VLGSRPSLNNSSSNNNNNSPPALETQVVPAFHNGGEMNF
jgi:hypothetical protein